MHKLSMASVHVWPAPQSLWCSTAQNLIFRSWLIFLNLVSITSNENRSPFSSSGMYQTHKTLMTESAKLMVIRIDWRLPYECLNFSRQALFVVTLFSVSSSDIRSLLVSVGLIGDILTSNCSFCSPRHLRTCFKILYNPTLKKATEPFPFCSWDQQSF